MAMVGAPIFIKEDDGISFRVGKNSTKCNHVYIKYCGTSDTYIMHFNRFSPTKGIKNLAYFNDVYVEDLQRLFADFTRLDTHL
jgi:hypothetical protein